MTLVYPKATDPADNSFNSIESLNKFFICKLDTIIHLSLLTILPSQAFRGDYHTVGGSKGGKLDESLIEMSYNQ